MKNKLPKVICIGAAKSGTSWLNECLKEHPEVSTPLRGEVDFYTYNWEKGTDWYSSHYDQNNSTVNFDCSPSYQYYKEVPMRIFETVGSDVKIIFVVRNPIDRLLSHYYMHLRGGRISEKINTEVFEYPRFIGDSLYFQNLKRFQEYFEPENLKIFLYDDLKENPVKFLQSIYSFIKLKDKKFVPSLINKKYHAKRPQAKYPGLYKILTGVLKKIYKSDNMAFLIPIVDFLRKKGPADIFHKYFGSTKSYPELSLDSKEKLVQIFRDDVSNLSGYVNKDLSAQWNLKS